MYSEFYEILVDKDRLNDEELMKSYEKRALLEIGLHLLQNGVIEKTIKGDDIDSLELARIRYTARVPQTTCKHCYFYDNETGFCNVHKSLFYSDDFCSDGIQNGSNK